MVHDINRAAYGGKNYNWSKVALPDRPGLEGHHSVGTYGASTALQFARKVEADHVGRGWLGAFYNFFVWPDGTIVQGRPLPATSGSVRWITVCLAGNYETRQMTAEMKAAVANIRSWALDQGLPTSVSWHGRRGSTACPGVNAIPFFRDELATYQGSETTYDLGDRVLRLTEPMQLGADVQRWQANMNKFLDNHGRPMIESDGYFGGQTAEVTAFFMDERLDVQTEDPRVGPRTIEAYRIWSENHAAGEGDGPDFEVAVLAATDVDEGAGLVLAQTNGWRYLRYPEQASDYRIGTAVLIGAAVARAQDDPNPTWDEVRNLAGADRTETGLLISRYLGAAGATTRNAPAV